MEPHALIARADLRRVARALLVLLLAGSGIGLFHRYDLGVAGVLAAITLYITWRTVSEQPPASSRLIIPAGVVLMGVLGINAELWGIRNGHWSYHDLAGGREVAYWLPFAWGLSFIFLYRVELSLLRIRRIEGYRNKLMLTLALSAVLPTWGEIVAIQLGTWSYHWGWQLFGVPLLAIVLLITFHTGVFALFMVGCRLFGIDEPVFGAAVARRGGQCANEKGEGAFAPSP